MNSRTAKLIRRYCVAKGVSAKSAKRAWLKLPAPGRNVVRKLMERGVE